MKKLMTLSAALLVLTAFTTPAPVKTWTLDQTHAKLGFSITHLMVSDVEGSFRILESSIKTQSDDFTDAIVTMKADVNSVDTDNADRDTHLKKADFLDAEKFPVITFNSTSFRKADEKNTYTVKGNLTLHGVTRPVELKAVARQGFNPMMKKNIAGFKITGTIKRTDFGVAPETSSALLSDEVQINANVEFVTE
jgi:polyisoprenoid-binding protein YceI